MKYFTMEECTYSDIAKAKGIDNTPNEEHKANIVESIKELIDPLREAWEQHCRAHGLGSPDIRISSGYRCPALNMAVGGSATSAHCHGYAFNLVPTNGKMMEFKYFCCNFLADKSFDQLISSREDSKGIPSWMEVIYKSSDGQQRQQLLSMKNWKYAAFS